MCLDGARAAKLLSLGRYSEAIKTFVAAGRFLDAIKLLLKSRSPDSTRQACSYILQELSKLMSFGFRAENAELSNITELLALSAKLEKSYLLPTKRNEVSLFDLYRITELTYSFEIRLKCSTAYTQVMPQRFANLEKHSSASIIFMRRFTVSNSSITDVFPPSKQ